MAKQVFESPDLLRLIYSFGDPEHRKFTRNLQSEIQSTSEEFDHAVQAYIKENKYCSVKEYLLQYSPEMIKKELSSYKRCFCCTRHSKNIPILSNNTIIIREQSVFENNDTTCQCHCPCPCRSLSRVFIRHLDYRVRMKNRYNE